MSGPQLSSLPIFGWAWQGDGAVIDGTSSPVTCDYTGALGQLENSAPDLSDTAAMSAAVDRMRARLATLPAFTPDGGTCTGADSEVCLSCGATPPIILVVPCSRTCCDLALCLDCASSQGYEIS